MHAKFSNLFFESHPDLGQESMERTVLGTDVFR